MDCCGKQEEDGNKINIVTRGGSKTREDATKKDQDQYQWVGKNTTPQQNFDLQRRRRHSRRLDMRF
jgi:hypothetical protein